MPRGVPCSGLSPTLSFQTGQMNSQALHRVEHVHTDTRHTLVLLFITKWDKEANFVFLFGTGCLDTASNLPPSLSFRVKCHKAD